MKTANKILNQQLFKNYKKSSKKRNHCIKERKTFSKND